MDALQVSDLVKVFESTTAVDHISFSVKSGQIFGLVGPDGAGKTTTIRMLSTILAPTSGKAMIAGFDINTEAEKIRANIGYMAQRFNLYEDLTIEENLYFFADVFNVSKRERDSKLADLYRFSGLEPFKDRRARFLSGGMKQKLALACTLIHEPDILFLDEPTTGVDPVSRRELWRILSEVNAKGVTLVISTPYLDEAERCTMVGFMSDGRLQDVTTPYELVSRYGGISYDIALPEKFEQACLLLQDMEMVLEIECFPGRVKLTIGKDSSIDEVLKVLETAGVKTGSCQALRPSMENAYIGLVRSLEEGKR